MCINLCIDKERELGGVYVLLNLYNTMTSTPLEIP